MYCDLHTHSIFSDGAWSPRQIVKAARQMSLTVALTDHNTVSGLPDFLEAAAEFGVEVVPGVEFSTDYRGKEVHIVALFVRPASYDAIGRFVAEGDRQKDKSNRDLIARLQEAGYGISYPEIVAQTPDGRVNRANIAAELVRKGCFSTVKEAFAQVLQEKHGFYVPPKRPDALDAVSFIVQIGAVPVLAHPYLSLEREEVEALLPQAVARGLMAMETRYPAYSMETTAWAQAAARRYGLLESGGSDFHGGIKPNNPLGYPRISRQIFEQLKAGHENR